MCVYVYVRPISFKQSEEEVVRAAFCVHQHFSQSHPFACGCGRVCLSVPVFWCWMMLLQWACLAKVEIIVIIMKSF